MLRILLTGYKGFIGQHLHRLLSNQHKIITYDWNDPVPEISDFDWVIHLGAITTTTDTDIDKMLTQNYDFSVNIINQCINSGVNFQFSSTASIYGVHCENFHETADPRPENYYALSKYLVERYITKLPTAATERTHIQIFRYFNVTGSGQDHKLHMASPDFKFANEFAKTGRIKLFKNSEQYWRDFVPVEKISKTHMDFLSVPESGIWNLGTGRVKNFYQIAKEITDDSNIDYVDMPENLVKSYQKYTCADITKIKATLAKYNMVY